MKKRVCRVLRAFVTIFLFTPLLLQAQSTAFTYQGRLNDGGSPATGIYDLRFTIYDLGSNGSVIAGPLTNSSTMVSNGLFTVALDFGAGVFTGPNRWLEIGVRTNGAGAFTTLAARQLIAPTPYSIFAENVGAGGISAGTYGNALTLNNGANSFNGSYTGNGGGLTNINALTLGGIGTNGFWKTSGNAGTTPGANFIGTSDNQPLELRVNGLRGLRLEPNTNGAPNVIAGSPLNFVSNGVFGATISGGGATNFSGGAYSNSVIAPFGTVGGGLQNAVQGEIATISGGFENSASGVGAFIGGGAANNASNGGGTIGGGQNNTNSGSGATISGGEFNVASGDGAFIGGGGFDGNAWAGNHADGAASVIGGGFANSVTNAYGTIGGGQNNTNNGIAGTIGGGNQNIVSNVYNATIAGGDFNRVGAFGAFVGGGNGNTASGIESMVPGGEENTASGNTSFAAGRQAQAINQGAFVWGDSQIGPYYSDRNDQVKFRAAGGVVIDVLGSFHLNPAALFVNSTAPDGVAFYAAQSSSDAAVVINNSGAGDLIKAYNANGNSPAFEVQNDGTVKSKNVVLTSDRNAKEEFAPVTPAAILDKVASLPITQWNYKADSREVQHVGPMAQDFHAVFGLNGSDDKHISMVDEGGVALAAIQGLNQKLEQKLEQKETEIADLKERLEKLEELINQRNGGAQ